MWDTESVFARKYFKHANGVVTYSEANKEVESLVNVEPN